ncbi:unnamed protein product [Periconia digitata]|uniref:Lipid droplet-associated hydrolase n=1 Tax=Periconia digitata TaxID=1303443 RepID=A0A9W4UDY2_9PLEO|nr:unnamed protein product [Periconia digitata]
MGLATRLTWEGRGHYHHKIPSSLAPSSTSQRQQRNQNIREGKRGQKMPTPPPQSEIYLHQPFNSINKTLQPHRKTYVIYFVTGNPGLIEYYRTFLTHLYGALLSDSSSQNNAIRFHVYGRSFSGFEVDGSDAAEVAKHATTPPPYSLDEQIAHSEAAVEELVRHVREENVDDGEQDVRVILMGHSVGAYVLLEMTRRLREKAKKLGPRESVRVVGGVCLFPTVTHIALSDSGRKSSWLLNIRPFARIASVLAKLLTLPLPVAALTLLIRGVMRFPADAAHTTASFVKSASGVRQALHMARDEMLQITTDDWDEEIWGTAEQGQYEGLPSPILRFLFAKSDHWVANETRDELMKARGAVSGREGDVVEEWRPIMEIDEKEGWPHGFCIKHSIPVADRVFGYVRDIVEMDSQKH